MSDRGVTLLRQPQERLFVPNRGEGFRLRIVASDAVDMPAAIFLHQKTLVDPYQSGGTVQDEFVCICSPFDLTIYPENEPATGQFPAFFRKSVVDIILPSMDTAADAWNAISTRSGGPECTPSEWGNAASGSSSSGVKRSSRSEMS